MKLINIGIAGCLGRMGQELVKAVLNNNNLNFTGGFEHLKHKDLNKKFSDVIDVNTHQIISDNPKKIFSESDVVVDFTTPQSTLQNVLIASEQSTPIVIGTTGLDEKVFDVIKQYSKKIPILQSSNMSISVNLIFELVKQSASTLKDSNYDIEIAETHHKHKVDAPSGTAITLGEYAAKGRKTNFETIKVFERTNSSLKRKIGNIGFAITRGGEIAGEHTVSFIGSNDRVDITHKAFSRAIFVKGALDAALFLVNKKNGLYSMKDVIRSELE